MNGSASPKATDFVTNSHSRQKLLACPLPNFFQAAGGGHELRPERCRMLMIEKFKAAPLPLPAENAWQTNHTHATRSDLDSDLAPRPGRSQSVKPEGKEAGRELSAQTPHVALTLHVGRSSRRGSRTGRCCRPSGWPLHPPISISTTTRHMVCMRAGTDPEPYPHTKRSLCVQEGAAEARRRRGEQWAACRNRYPNPKP